MPSSVSQVNCPSCNAPHATSGAGSYTCEFCLQPFSVADAQKEQARLLDEIRSWVEQRVGSGGSGGGVDASSRAFIFQQRILPDTEREVNRAVEAFGSFGSFPLILPPVPVGTGSAGSHPLVAARGQVLALKGLRARLASDQVNGFAVTDADRAAVHRLERRLGELTHLSNVADAADDRTPAGYAAARRNLLALNEELRAAHDTATDPGQREQILLLAQRYALLADCCGICEELASPNPVSGASAGDRIGTIISGLAAVGDQLTRCTWSPAETMPLTLGIRAEVNGARLLERWVRAYDAITSRAPTPFSSLVALMAQLFASARPSAEEAADLVEGAAIVLRMMRGEAAAPVIGDFGWVQGWAEGARTKKMFGLFGTEETIQQVEEFLLPVWTADFTYSRREGTVLKRGVELSGLAVVDACAPAPANVTIFLDGAGPVPRALCTLQQLPAAEVALPRSNAAAAQETFKAALRQRPDILNPTVRVRGLAFVAAAVAQLSGKTTREIASTVPGTVPVDPAARWQKQMTQELKRQFG
jgi:hypothetical protein